MEHKGCHSKKSGASIDKKLVYTSLVFVTVLLLSFIPHRLIAPLNESLLIYLGLVWWAVLLGLFIGGLIEYFVPDVFIANLLGRNTVRSVFYAVIAGFFMSACSHGIHAIAIQLYKKGASPAATVTFLLASPWANLPVTILLFSFFGRYALLFVLAAMLIAIITGLIFHKFEKWHLIETSINEPADKSPDWSHISNINVKDSVTGVATGAISLANMVLWWILIGILLAALIGAYVPHHLFTHYFDSSFSGLGLTLLVATLIEICSEGSAPIALEIFNNVGALGNPFVFLMAGVVTDYTEIGLIWSNVGKRTAIWLPIIAVPQVLLMGYLFNTLLS